MLSERVDRWLGGHRFAVDAVCAAAMVLVCALPLMIGSPGPGLLAAAIIGPLAWRRTRPTLSWVLCALAAVLQTAVALEAGPTWYTAGLLPADGAVLIAVYSSALHAPRLSHRAAFATAAVGSLVIGLLLGGPDPLAYGGVTLLALVSVLAAAALGSLRRVRLDRFAALRERAHLLEVERDQKTRLAVSGERTRVAREMHDIVAHSLAVVIAQADGGLYAARSSPEAATQALTTIGETGRSALAEMRRLLAVLRDDGALDEASASWGGPAPQPALADLPALVERVREGGLAVTCTERGEPWPMAAGPQLAAYRVVQEGLTNVLKHAGPGSTADVRLVWTTAALEIRVLDDGRGAGAAPGDAAEPPGLGLVGMRERVGASDGTVHAGPRPGGGFEVRVVFSRPA